MTILLSLLAAVGLINYEPVASRCPSCHHGDDDDILGNRRSWRNRNGRCRRCGARLGEHPDGTQVIDPE